MSFIAKLKDDKDANVVLLDKHGNALVKYNDGRVVLYIASEDRVRKVGVIADKCLYVERTYSKHLHRKSNSYGFNYELLKRSGSFDKIVLSEDDTATYAIPKSTILSLGKVMFFKNSADGNSFEVQIFLNRDIIILYKKNEN